MKVQLLANPRSGRGKGPALGQELVRLLRARGHEAELHIGQGSEDAVDWMRRASAEAERLVVLGGDGSLSTALQGYPNPGPPVAFVALGTSNLLAHQYRLPRAPEQVVPLVEQGKIQKIDLARANERTSFLVCGFGLDGELMRRMEERRSGPIHVLQYFPILCRMVLEFRCPPQRVIADGEDLGEWTFGLVAGLARYGRGSLSLGPFDPTDGRWELYLIHKVGVFSGLWLAARARFGGFHRSRWVERRLVRQVRIEGARPAPSQVDGDFAGFSPIEFEVTDRQLSLLIPA